MAQSGGRYTKHIYIGSQRIVSKLGDFDSYGADPRRIEKAGDSFNGVKVDYASKYKSALNVVKANYESLKVPYYGLDNDDYVNGLGFCCNPNPTTATTSPTGKTAANKTDNAELQQYYYHPDHLGSSSYITNLDGEVVQHVEYVPFGEVFLEEKNAVWNTPYLFNGKELDKETGLSYYGARYYESKISVWISVDPLADFNPIMNDEHYIDGEHNGGVYNSGNLNSYGYCYQNPVKYVDPNGKQVDVIDFIPFVGSARDIYRGVRDGDMTTLAIGVGGLALDIATAGTGGSIIKGGIKASLKQVAEIGAKQAFKHATIQIAETTLKQGYKLRTALKLVAKDGMQAHHLIPKELLKKSQVVKDAVSAGFDFNGVINGLAVKGSHGPHKGYTDSIMGVITDWQKNNPKYTIEQAKSFMEKLANQAKEAIIENGGNVKATRL